MSIPGFLDPIHNYVTNMKKREKKKVQSSKTCMCRYLGERVRAREREKKTRPVATEKGQPLSPQNAKPAGARERKREKWIVASNLKSPKTAVFQTRLSYVFCHLLKSN